MATRIAFSTHYPDRMKELAGKPTYFPEKVMCGIYPDFQNMIRGLGWMVDEQIYTPDLKSTFHPKTTTIRSNYEYWKAKEGQLLQPFFWAGKPYRSKQVVFCPEVRLGRVRKVNINPSGFVPISVDRGRDYHSITGLKDIERFTQNEGFDHPDHFWMWFDRDFSGALLELESVEG